MSVPARALGRLRPNTTALFVCDIQERFREHIHGFAALASASQKMLAAAKLLDVPVYVTEQYPQRLGKTVEELDISAAEVVLPKTKFSMFLPEIQEALRTRKITSIILLGIEAHVCVQQTALDLLENDYDVHVLSDAVSSMNYPETQLALERLRQSGAFITSSESALFQLAGDAKHPNFKEISNLVKKYQEATRTSPLLYKSSI
ncbi:hypothetical protein IWQ60_000881 [Tieghemiomyces parasiticus]|uniref:Isochorismatase-like domain-containing protein n=1 Tax=Tieghemiomyces parasiticus TaxID=78921 RepID=A0A9W8AM11_9FUNG|nr:hypothetical protein IWQ60_004630 [Tieghemiomyces parasiticus]KAJ1929792.1 hypothetical protein IWQ60_000881 [Tieghemiomyces parasiticus]